MAERPFARRMLRCFGSAREKIMKLWELLQAAAAANIGARAGDARLVAAPRVGPRRACARRGVVCHACERASRRPRHGGARRLHVGRGRAHVTRRSRRARQASHPRHNRRHGVGLGARTRAGGAAFRAHARRSRLGRRRRRRLDAGAARRRARERHARPRRRDGRLTRPVAVASRALRSYRPRSRSARTLASTGRISSAPSCSATTSARGSRWRSAASRSATRARRSTHAYAGTFGRPRRRAAQRGSASAAMRWLLDYASQQAAGYAVWGRDSEHVEKAFVFGGMPARAA